MSKKRLKLPCLKGKMGDWYYYVSLMKFKDVADRVSMVPDIHKSKKLSNLIQREVSNRSTEIVEYLKNQHQRFFNSLILGIYGGKPQWHEFTISTSEINEYSENENQEYIDLNEEEQDYFDSSLGILVLNGDEKIFAIDGQHRTKAIQDAVKADSELFEEEIATIFVAHKNSDEGLERTRRLFSTLNRYAKPVEKSEIIAIDEEDNAAIITRRLVEEFYLLKEIILFRKTRSISVNDTSSFSNIIVLYDFISTILTDKDVFNISVTGYPYKEFTRKRIDEKTLEDCQIKIQNLFIEIFNRIPPLSEFLKTTEVDRRDRSTSLLFRPIGQNILYSVLKVAIDHNKKEEALTFFESQNFSLENPVWKKIFLDDETGRIKTTKERQKFAFQLILMKLEIKFKKSPKDIELFENFDISIDDF